MGCGSSREDRAGHGFSAGVSPEQHSDQKRPQGLQQQWDTQGLKGSSFSSLGLAPLRSRKCCWYRAPWGDGTGWDGGNQLNMSMAVPSLQTAQGICASSALPCSATGAGGTRMTSTQECPCSVRVPQPWRAGGSATCSSWSTVTELPNSQPRCFHSTCSESILQLSG